jgi:hypothetical protein
MSSPLTEEGLHTSLADVVLANLNGGREQIRQQLILYFEIRGKEPLHPTGLLMERIDRTPNRADLVAYLERLEGLIREDTPKGPSSHRRIPPLDRLRHLLQTRFPVLYAQVLGETLADLRAEHSVALAEGRPLKARRVLLQGCGALAAAAICQLGFSLLGRIAALWQARSSK